MFKALPLIICPCSVKDGGDGFHPCSVKDGGVNVGDCKREGAGEDGGGEVGKDITQITTSEWRNGGIETGITGRKEEWIHMDGNGRREAKTSAGHKKVDGARDGSGRTSLPDMVHKDPASLVRNPGAPLPCGSALFSSIPPPSGSLRPSHRPPARPPSLTSLRRYTALPPSPPSILSSILSSKINHPSGYFCHLVLERKK